MLSDNEAKHKVEVVIREMEIDDLLGLRTCSCPAT